MRFEYMKLLFDFNDLTALNQLGKVGWEVKEMRPVSGPDGPFQLLLMRHLPPTT